MHADAQLLHEGDNSRPRRLAARGQRLAARSPDAPEPTTVSRFASPIPTAWPARGVMTTPHGDVETPAFMPVGTQGAVKAVTRARPRRDRRRGSSSATPITCICGPGDELIARRGGLHRFIGWTRADPHRQRRLPGVQPGGAPHGRRAGRAFPVAPRRQRAPADARAGGRHPGAARVRHRDGARRVSAASRRRRDACATSRRADAALGAARCRDAVLEPRSGRVRRTCGRHQRRARRSSASCRAACSRICAPRAPTQTRRRSASTAMPSAA